MFVESTKHYQFKNNDYTKSVSYTHLDVYKRQNNPATRSGLVGRHFEILARLYLMDTQRNYKTTRTPTLETDPFK